MSNIDKLVFEDKKLVDAKKQLGFFDDNISIEGEFFFDKKKDTYYIDSGMYINEIYHCITHLKEELKLKQYFPQNNPQTL